MHALIHVQINNLNHFKNANILLIWLVHANSGNNLHVHKQIAQKAESCVIQSTRRWHSDENFGSFYEGLQENST